MRAFSFALAGFLSLVPSHSLAAEPPSLAPLTIHLTRQMIAYDAATESDFVVDQAPTLVEWSDLSLNNYLIVRFTYSPRVKSTAGACMTSGALDESCYRVIPRTEEFKVPVALYKDPGAIQIDPGAIAAKLSKFDQKSAIGPLTFVIPGLKRASCKNPGTLTEAPIPLRSGAIAPNPEALAGQRVMTEPVKQCIPDRPGFSMFPQAGLRFHDPIRGLEVGIFGPEPTYFFELIEKLAADKEKKPLEPQTLDITLGLRAGPDFVFGEGKLVVVGALSPNGSRAVFQLYTVGPKERLSYLTTVEVSIARASKGSSFGSIETTLAFPHSTAIRKSGLKLAGTWPELPWTITQNKLKMVIPKQASGSSQ